MIDTILFDLDGTLLPMDTPQFFALYAKALGENLAQFGLPPKQTIDAVWRGTAAMVENDGKLTNGEVFWRHFAADMGQQVLQMQPQMERFYEEGYEAVRAACGENPGAAPLVQMLKQRGFTVVLATNPLYPLVAVRTRLTWIGLSPQDFDFVTWYGNSHYSKPNPAYFTEILQSIGKNPAQCLHIGNDAHEDGCALDAGIPVYLMEDCLLNAEARPAHSFVARGSFDDCRQYLQQLC